MALAQLSQAAMNNFPARSQNMAGRNPLQLWKTLNKFVSECNLGVRVEVPFQLEQIRNTCRENYIDIGNFGLVSSPDSEWFLVLDNGKQRQRNLNSSNRLLSLSRTVWNIQTSIGEYDSVRLNLWCCSASGLYGM